MDTRRFWKFQIFVVFIYSQFLVCLKVGVGVCWEDTGHSAILEISVFCCFVFYSIPNFALDKNLVLEYFGDDTGHSRILEISVSFGV